MKVPKMKVLIKEKSQLEQVQTVLENLQENNNTINVFTKDKEVISLKRSLLLVYSPFLRSLLGSLSMSVSTSAPLLIPSYNHKSLINLEKLLMNGYLDEGELERSDVEEIVEVGEVLGINLNSLIEDFDKKFGTEYAERPSSSDELIINSPDPVSVELDSEIPMVKIKIEEEDDYIETAVRNFDVFREIKEESTMDVQESNADISRNAASVSNGESQSNLVINQCEDGELEESDDQDSNDDENGSPKLTEFEVNLAETEDTLEIETNPTEIEELLNATKNELEKFLERKSSKTVDPIIIALTPSPDPSVGLSQSSTSVKYNKKDAIDSSSKINQELSETESKTAENEYPCNICQFETDNSLQIMRHMKSTHKCFYKFQCKKCPFDSSNIKDYKEHICKVRPEAKFRCTKCSFKTHIPDHIKVHMKNKHNALYCFKCDQCEFETPTYHKLESHKCSDQRSKSGSRNSPADQSSMVGLNSNSSLCMRCGRHHKAPCNHPEDSACEEPNCGIVGHVQSLHHPLTMSDFNSIQQRDSLITLEKDKLAALTKSKGAGALFSCKECPYKSTKATAIKYHCKKIHQSPYLFTCNVCMFSTTENKMFPDHKCKEEILECQKCDFITRKALMMKKHNESQHESEMYACGQCNSKCKTYESYKKHRMFFCKNRVEDASVRRPRSRESYQPLDTPVRRENLLTPNSRSYSRSRTRNPSSTYSSYSSSPSRGPTTPFPPPAVLYLEQAREQDLYLTTNPMPKQRGARERRTEPRPKTMLCMRCGRRHMAPCKHPEDSWCSEPGCGMTGHVVNLHHPKTVNDYKLLRSKIPGLLVKEPSEKNDSLKSRKQTARSMRGR